VANFSQTLPKLLECKRKKDFSKISHIFWMEKATKVFRRKNSVSITFHKEGPKKTQKPEKTIIY
jgi:hypothetical protein